MKKTLVYLFASFILFQSNNCFAEKKLSHEEKIVYEDIGSLLLGQPQEIQITSATDGIYIESLFCRKQTPPLTTLLKRQLSIQQDQELISLFQNMFCATGDDASQVSLSAFADHIQNPLPFSLVSYSGLQKLGSWSLNDSIVLSNTPPPQVNVNMFGLDPKQVSNSVIFWQVLSPTNVRVWYSMFKMAPSDALTYEFKFVEQHWKLTHLWMTTRL